MAVILTLRGKTPINTQFGLDVFTESYKCDATADVVLTDVGVPQMGDEHPDYPFMFVTSRYCSETGESASSLDLVYTGSMTDDGDGGPNIPTPKATTAGQVASSSTNTDATIYPALTTNPLTLQFYAITNTLSYFTDNVDDPDAPEPDDPPEVTGDQVITWDFGFGYQPALNYPDLIIYLLTIAYVQGINEPPPIVEPIVFGQFWQVTKQKTRTLFPYAPPA